MTFRTPNLLLEPMAEKHLGFVQAEASKGRWRSGFQACRTLILMTARGLSARVQLMRRGNRSAGWSLIERPERSRRRFGFLMSTISRAGLATGSPPGLGSGVATEAAFHVLDLRLPLHGGRDGDQRRVPRQPASRRVLEKVG